MNHRTFIMLTANSLKLNGQRRYFCGCAHVFYLLIFFPVEIKPVSYTHLTLPTN